MRNDLLLRPWSIASSSPGWHDDFLESVYFLGNGRMGVRGYLPFEPDPRPVQKGLFIAGIFGEIKPGITDFVNLPAPICNRLFLDGVPAVLASFIERKLDFRHDVSGERLTVQPRENRPELGPGKRGVRGELVRRGAIYQAIIPAVFDAFVRPAALRHVRKRRLRLNRALLSQKNGRG